DLEGPMFLRWLDLFGQTLAEFDNPPFVEQAQEFARRVARSLWYGYQISHHPDQPPMEFAHVSPGQY
ncbi:MAG TPA: preprotein translocase subunit TatC, partial [Castellaniella sp.]|nr:preprotein translocase subunit TatC [Castellaniella sp.]